MTEDPIKSAARRRARRRTDVVAPIVVSILVAAVVGAMIPAPTVPVMVFVSLGLTVVVWGLAFVAAVRRDPVPLGLGLSPLVFLAALLPQLAALNYHQAHLARQVAEQKQMRSLVDVLRGGVSDMDAGRLPKAPATGDGGPAQTLLATELRTLEANKLNCQANIRATGVLKALAPANLAADPSLRRTRASIAQAGTVLDGCIDAYHQEQADWPQKVAAINAPESVKATLTRILGAGPSAVANDAIWNLDRDQLRQLKAVTDFLYKTRLYWVPVNGKLVFTDPGVLRSYQTGVRNLQLLGQQQAALEANFKADRQAALDELSHSAP